jgi:hypothetical protein
VAYQAFASSAFAAETTHAGRSLAHTRRGTAQYLRLIATGVSNVSSHGCRGPRSRLAAVDVLFELLDRHLLLGHDAVHQIAD